MPDEKPHVEWRGPNNSCAVIRLTKNFLVRDYSEDFRMSCPICGDQYVHADSHRELRGYEPTDRNPRDTYDYEVLDSHWVRGHTDQISFWCESGCQFALQLGQHKGNTYFRVIQLPDHGHPYSATSAYDSQERVWAPFPDMGIPPLPDLEESDAL